MIRDARDIGVIFDMDGVLIDSADAHFRSWQVLAEEHGARVTRDQFQRTFGRANRDIVPLLFGDVSATELIWLADRKEEIYRDSIRADPPLVEGASRLLEELHARGARLAVGSSGPPANIRLVVESLKAAAFFGAVVSGDDVQRGKPDPQVFALAARRLELPPAQCVVVEDAPVGVQAAQAAGMRAVAVMIHHSAQAFPGADLVVERLAELSADRLIELARCRQATGEGP